MRRLLWAMRYRLYEWLRVRSPRDIDDYLMAYPDARYGLRILTPKMKDTFDLMPIRLTLYRDPECGGTELHLVACIPDTMSYEDAEKRMDKVHEWAYHRDDYHRLTKHIHLRFDWE